MSSEGKIRYLSDTPIDSVEDDEFRHKEYVDTLEKMVVDVDPPWNIGVFGEWGSGKTSIIRMLYSRLEDRDYVCVEFDAWKHAEESIRTDLLLNLDQAIGEKTGQRVDDQPAVLGEDRITRELYDVEEDNDGDDLSAIEEAKRIYTESPLVGGVTILLLGIIAVGAFVNALTILGLLQIADPTLSSLNSILSAFLFPLFISVFVFMAGEVRKATSALRRKHPRKEWSGAYEQLFNEIIRKSDSDKILITIDNLDRCESETVYDVLVSLKTFLENEDCIYIVPCDNRALQSHIESIDERGEYFENQTNEREFLRKFFQTHIRIPPFIEEDIEEYARTKNDELAEPFAPEVLDIITKAYVKNPRRIKQSLNRLITLRTLAGQVEDADHLADGSITENLDFLAKAMVLEEDYPRFYGEFQEDPRLIEDVNNYFRGDLSDDNRTDRIKSLLNTDGTTDSDSQLEYFLSSTRRCMVDNPKPFLRLGEPSFTSDLKDADTFIQNLWTGQENEVREELRNVRDDDQVVASYIRTIDSRLGEYHRERRHERLFSTIDTLVSVFDEFNESQQEDLAQTLGTYLIFDDLRDFFYDFDPEELFPVLLKIPGEDHSIVFKRFAQVVVSGSKLRENALKAFVEYAENVPREAADQLCDEIMGIGQEELKSALEILSSRTDSKKLANPALLERTVNLTEWNGNRNRFNGTQHYKQFDSQAGPRGRQHYVERLLIVKSQINDGGEDQYYAQLEKEISDLQGQVTQNTGSKLFDEIQEGVSSTSGRSSSLIKNAITFFNSYDAESREEFYDWIANEIKRSRNTDIRQIIRHADEQDTLIFKKETVVEATLNQIPNKLDYDDFIVDELIPMISGEHDDLLFNLVDQLTGDRDQQENLLAAKILREHPDRFKEVQNSILDCSRDQVKRADNAGKKKIYLQAEIAVYDRLEDTEREGLVSRLDSLLSGDRSEHKAFRELWNEIEEEIEPERRTAVARNLRDQFQTELRGNVNPNQLFPLLDSFLSLTKIDGVDEDDGEWAVERLSAQFEDSDLNNKQVSRLVEKMSEFPNFYGNEEQVLDRLENLCMNNNNNNSQVHSSAEKLVNALGEIDSLDQDKINNVKDGLNT